MFKLKKYNPCRNFNEKKKEATRIEGTKTSHKLENYTGTYKDPGYGEITIQKKDDQLNFTYHDITTPLQHWHYDVFNGLKAEDPVFEDMKLQFRSNMDGYIAKLLVPMEPRVEPITFKKQPDKKLSNPDYLTRFTGKYVLADDTISVSLSGNMLQLNFPGQPTYTLIPTLGDRFNLKEYSVVSIEFQLNDKGLPEALLLDQPGGRYTAKRVND